MVWFSSGAAHHKETSAYGLSKFIQERLCTTSNENIYGLRVFGCFGPDENSSRFLSTCIREGHVDIVEDRYFDFFDVHDLGRIIDYIFEN
jgi:nucleoside-diphosphate-sugar epimerase